jgi:hypothetical protein
MAFACGRRSFALKIEEFRGLAHPPNRLTPDLPTAEQGPLPAHAAFCRTGGLASAAAKR